MSNYILLNTGFFSHFLFIYLSLSKEVAIPDINIFNMLFPLIFNATNSFYAQKESIWISFLTTTPVVDCGQSLKHPCTIKVCISTRLLFQFCILRRHLDRGQHVRIHSMKPPSLWRFIHHSIYYEWWSNDLLRSLQNQRSINWFSGCFHVMTEPLVAHRAFAQPAFTRVGFPWSPR